MIDVDYLASIRAAAAQLQAPTVRLMHRVPRGQMYILGHELTGRGRVLVLHPSMRRYAVRLGLSIEYDESLPRHARRRFNKARSIARHNARKAAR